MKALLYLIVACVALSIGSCTRTMYVPVENTVHHTDTLRMLSQRVDSLWIHDSIVVQLRGDTVWIEKYRDRFQYLLRTDTLWHSRVDSIVKREPYPVEVVKSVPKELTKWQRCRLWLGNIMLAIIIAALGLGAWKLWRKFKT